MKNYIENTATTTEFHAMSETASSGTVVSFLGLNLNPVPFVSMTLEKYTAGDKALGGQLNVSLNGVFHGTDFDNTSAKFASKLESFASGHKCLTDIKIHCGGSNIITSGIGYIKDYSFPEGPQKNWMNIIPYTINLVVSHTEPNKPVVHADPEVKTKYNIQSDNFIRSIKESVSYSINENTMQTYHPDPEFYNTMEQNHPYSNEHIVVKYNIDVAGYGVCCSGNSTNSALGSAKNVIDYRIHNLQNLTSESFNCATGIFPVSYNTSVRYNHTRNVNVNELDGSLSVDGEYIIRPSGVNSRILMTVDADANSSLDSGEKTVTLNGNIRGLMQNEYRSPYSPNTVQTTMTAKKTAMDEAENELLKIVNDGSGIIRSVADKNGLLNFTTAIGDAARNAAKPLFNSTSTTAANTWQGGDSGADEFRLLTKSFKRNYPDSSIDFTLTYSNKSRHKIPNALWAEISIDHELPSRRLAEHVIPGRGYPLLQDVLCDTQDVFTINVTAQFEPQKNIHNIIAAAQEHILLLIYKTAESLNAEDWIRTGDSENIANNGSYKRSIKLTRPTCVNGTATNTNLDYLEAQPPSYVNAASYTPATQRALTAESGYIPPSDSEPTFDKTRDLPST